MKITKDDMELDNKIIQLISTFSYERKKAFIFFLLNAGDLKGEELFLYLVELFFVADQ
ncbi:hypothetical protein Q654_00023 [Bartonella henselae JK 50]|nr:hypothetical protein Q654_00023 [Bartonella henselae JK 50]